MFDFLGLGLGLRSFEETFQRQREAVRQQEQAAMNDGLEALRRQQQANAMKTLTQEEYDALLDKPKLLTKEDES